MNDTLDAARLAELRKVAEAATQDKWLVRRESTNSGIPRIFIEDGIQLNDVAEVYTNAAESFGAEVAAHVATFDPPTVLALLDAAERAEAMRNALTLCADTLEGHLDEPQAVSHGECRLAAKVARASLASAAGEKEREER